MKAFIAGVLAVFAPLLEANVEAGEPTPRMYLNYVHADTPDELIFTSHGRSHDITHVVTSTGETARFIASLEFKGDEIRSLANESQSKQANQARETSRQSFADAEGIRERDKHLLRRSG